MGYPAGTEQQLKRHTLNSHTVTRKENQWQAGSDSKNTHTVAILALVKEAQGKDSSNKFLPLFSTIAIVQTSLIPVVEMTASGGMGQWPCPISTCFIYIKRPFVD
ncbi:unnamed protein product [Caretta caretta]